MSTMEPDWDEENDEEEYKGPDAYLEGEDIDEDDDYDVQLDTEDQIEALEEELDATENEVEGTDPPGVEDERPSIQDLLQGFLDLENLSSIASNNEQETRRISIRAQLSTLLNVYTARGLTYTRGRADDEDDEDDEDDGYIQPKQWHEEVKVPEQAGLELLMSGEFGTIRNKIRSRAGRRNIARILRSRESSTKQLPKEDVAADLVPNSNGTVVVTHDHNIYSGQFSADSSFYYTCSQDFRLHIYDTKAPLQTSAPTYRQQPYQYARPKSTMKLLKTIQGRHGQWTITDSHLSPDNDRMIYSSITPTVYMTKTLDSEPSQVPIHFSDPPSPQARAWGGRFWDDDGFGIYSCRFSADGNEVIAGGNGMIFVYDLLANRRTVKISAHKEDVNSCCWADSASGNVLISASDDTFLKVWDRRSLGASTKSSGVLIGHTEGITNVSAKGDGRYVISNGKDQTLRLWDLRKMRTNAEYDAVKYDSYGQPGFDYRRGSYRRPKYKAHPQDCSVMTYRGHSVLRTLIRCHFSPAETTGGQYLYSGSSDGRIHIWSLDGRVVQVLDRNRSLPMSFDPSAPEPQQLPRSYGFGVCVRDVSWHSNEPVLMSAGWEDRRSGGSTIARHEWKGLSKMGGRLEDLLEKDRVESEERTPLRRSARLSRRQVPGSFQPNEDEESDEDDDDYME